MISHDRAFPVHPAPEILDRPQRLEEGRNDTNWKTEKERRKTRLGRPRLILLTQQNTAHCCNWQPERESRPATSPGAERCWLSNDGACACWLLGSLAFYRSACGLRPFSFVFHLVGTIPAYPHLPGICQFLQQYSVSSKFVLRGFGHKKGQTSEGTPVLTVERCATRVHRGAIRGVNYQGSGNAPNVLESPSSAHRFLSTA